MRHSVENYIIFILLFSVNCIILYPKYFSYGENGIFVEQSLYIWGIERSGFFNGREKWAKGFENQRV